MHVLHCMEFLHFCIACMALNLYLVCYYIVSTNLELFLICEINLVCFMQYSLYRCLERKVHNVKYFSCQVL